MVFGLRYYNDSRNQFRTTEDPYTLLAPLPKPEPIQSALEKACKAALRNHPDRSQITMWMASTQLPNRSEVRGLFRMLLQLKPRCSKQLPVALVGLRCMVRLDMPSKFPAEVALLREWADEVFTCALQAHRGDKKLGRKANRDLVFLQLHRSVLGLVMDSADIDVVMKAEGNFKAIKEERLTCAAMGLCVFLYTMS